MLALVVSLFLNAVTATGSADDEALVLAASPFVSISTPDHPVSLAYSFDRADLDNTGNKDYIIAMYGDGYDGSLRVLKPQGTNPNVVAEAAPSAMVGSGPTLRLVDLDGDGKLEIVAAGRVNHGQTWVYRWSGASLVLLSPYKTTRRGVQLSLLGMAEFFDVDGDGVLEIVNSPATPGDDRSIYKRDLTGRYVPSGSVRYVNNFIRTSDPTDVCTGVFGATAGETLRVTVTLVAAAATRPATDIFVNGSQVLASGNLSLVVNSGARSIWRAEATVSAETDNELEVDLSEGAAGSVATVSIVSTAPVPASMEATRQ